MTQQNTPDPITTEQLINFTKNTYDELISKRDFLISQGLPVPNYLTRELTDIIIIRSKLAKMFPHNI